MLRCSRSAGLAWPIRSRETDAAHCGEAFALLLVVRNTTPTVAARTTLTAATRTAVRGGASTCRCSRAATTLNQTNIPKGHSHRTCSTARPDGGGARPPREDPPAGRLQVQA